MKASLLLLLFVWRARAKRGIMVPGVPSETVETVYQNRDVS